MNVTLTNTARSEWTKFRSIPSNLPSMLVAVVLMVAMGAVTANGASENYLAASAAGKANFDSTYISMYGGFLFAQISVGSLGALIMTSEHATGTIRASLTVVPRRGRLLVAKVGTFGLFSLVVGVVSSFAAFFLGQAALGAGGAPTASLGEPGVLRAILGMGLIWGLVGLTGVAIGSLLRTTTSAITTVVTVNFIIPIIGPRLLPEAAGTWVSTYWPISAGLQITTTVQNPAELTPWVGLGLMTAFTAILLIAAFALFRSRDA